MTSNGRSPSIQPFLYFPVLGLLLSCADSFLPPPQTQEHPLAFPLSLDHPDSLLKGLQVAYNSRNIDQLSSLFAPDYVYTFAVDSSSYSWNAGTDLQAVANVFSNAPQLYLSFYYDNTDTSVAPPVGNTLVAEGNTSSGSSKGMNICSREELVFKQGPVGTTNTRQRWYIVSWRELEPPDFLCGPAPEALTLSQVKRTHFAVQPFLGH